MRRLLIRLVAVETALVGWMSYWLFLLYANNPLVNQGLAVQLGRFPQLSFTTIDISVLAIIAGLSIFLAFKFQRGLRPGIRLERALQMLENLMKRNLVLEAQVAEMKMEKARVGPASPSAVQTSESSPGSWERAFRTPIEAGPATPMTTTRVSPGAIDDRAFRREGSIARFSRSDTRPVHPASVPATSKVPQPAEWNVDRAPAPAEKVSSKPEEKTSTTVAGFEHESWEDSPKRVSETTGVLTPSPVPRSPAGVIPVSPKQPYIPVPVPRAAPPGVIVGPGSPRGPQLRPIMKPVIPTQATPRSSTPLSVSVGKPSGPLAPVGPTEGKAPPLSTASPAPPLGEDAKQSTAKPEVNLQPTISKVEPAIEPLASELSSKAPEKGEKKPDAKSPAKSLKKFPYEEDD